MTSLDVPLLYLAHRGSSPSVLDLILRDQAYS
jgi:hypothetical protein